MITVNSARNGRCKDMNSHIAETCAAADACVDRWWLQTVVCRCCPTAPESCWSCCSVCKHHYTDRNGHHMTQPQPTIIRRTAWQFGTEVTALGVINEVTLHWARLLLDRWPSSEGQAPWYATSHPGQLSLLPSVGQEIKYSLKCSDALQLRIKEGMAHSICRCIRGWQVNLSDPLLTHAIPEHLRDESYSLYITTQMSCLIYLPNEVGNKSVIFNHIQENQPAFTWWRRLLQANLHNGCKTVVYYKETKLCHTGERETISNHETIVSDTVN